MRLSTAFLFLTFVLSSTATNAAPSSPTPRPGFPSGDEARPSSPPPEPEKTGTVQWATPPPLADGESLPAVDRAPRASRGDWNIEAHAGYAGGFILEKDEQSSGLLAGALLSRPLPDFEAWDFRAELGNSAKWLRIGAGKRYYFGGLHSGDPYWKLELTQAFEAKRFLSAAVDLERMKLFAELGIADLFEKDGRLNVEGGLGWGLIGISYHAHLGWNF